MAGQRRAGQDKTGQLGQGRREEGGKRVARMIKR
jgi:hypothetical protein